MRTLRVICVSVLMVLLAPMQAWAAGSAPHWSVQATEDPAGSQGASLYGVACMTGTDCTAVGGYVDASGIGRTLAEHRDGSTWSIRPTPNPPGAVGANLDGVVCTEGGDCTAVGYANMPTSLVTLVERWDGSTWSIQASPNPPGTPPIAFLNGVACTSPTACVAAGSYVNGSSVGVTLIERWNGKRWSVEPSPNPPRSSEAYFDGIACSGASACTAVGSSTRGSRDRTLVERWDGTTWSIEASPNPPGATSSLLAGVACTGDSACVAAGSSSAHGATALLVLAWDGSRWSIEPTPEPRRAATAALTGVACTSETACMAVGYWTTASHPSGSPLAERWTGHAWKLQKPPVPDGARAGSLDAVTCSGAASCSAVGTYEDASNVFLVLAEGYTGHGRA